MNGLALIIAAMKNFPNDARVQDWACDLLSNLSNWEEFRAPISAAAGRQALLDAIETLKDESKEYVKDMQTWARRALKNCCERENSYLWFRSNPIWPSIQ